MSYQATTSYLCSSGSTSFLYNGTSSDLQTIIDTYNTINWYANDADTGIITNILVTGASVINGETSISGDKDFTDGDNYYFTPGPCVTTSSNGSTDSVPLIGDITYVQVGWYMHGVGDTNTPEFLNAVVTNVDTSMYNVISVSKSVQFTSGNAYYFTRLPIPILPIAAAGNQGDFTNNSFVEYCQANWYAQSATLFNVQVDESIYDNGTGVWIIRLHNTNLTNYQFSTTEPVYFTPTLICFKEGSKILSLINGIDTYVKIEELNIGDLVKTYLHDYKKIVKIGKSKLNNLGDNARIKDRLYKYTKEQYPELIEDLVITGGHSILVDELTEEQKEKTKKYWKIFHKTDDKYRLLSVVDDNSIPYEEDGVFNIYHISLENDNENANYGIYANGLLVESCPIRFIKNMILTE